MPLINQAMMPLSRLSPSHSSSSHPLILPRLRSFDCPKPTTVLKSPHFTCQASITDQGQLVNERKTNYYSTIWDYNHMQTLSNGYDEKEYKEELEQMKEEVRCLIKTNEDDDPLVKLELIDVIQQLGLGYHFEAGIRHALDVIDKGAEDSRLSDNLYATALRFRLLRQHGYKVPQDVFRGFMNGNGNFRESLQEDVEGLLSLYEASFLGLKGETIIDKAWKFSGMCLKNMEKNKLPNRLAMKVDRALDTPMHWRPNRLVARWFMGVYEEEPDMIPTLLKLAKLDFNVVQSFHLKEIGKLIRWWVDLGMYKLRFARDATMEDYMFSVLMLFNPKYEAFRVVNAKIANTIILIDDVYDAYGSLEEFELLTDFIDRWDITGIDKLPHTIKAVLLTLYNTTNEIGHWALIEHGINVIPYLQKAWADQCKAYLVEAKWTHKGLNPPTLKEYLNTAAASVGGMIMQQWCFMASADKLTAETLDYVFKVPRITYSSTLVLRLVNDLATSLYGQTDGDNLKAVDYYMNETGASKEAARDHMKYLIRETWKIMNEEMFDHHPLSRTFANACLDHARANQYYYQLGNGHDLIREKARDDLISLLIQPVPMD